MNWLTILILGLATWRLSALLSKEAGPFHMFEKLREKMGIQHDSNGQVTIIPSNFFAELLSCVWCTSIWVGGFWVILYLISPVTSLYIALPFALSTIAIIADHLL